MAGGRWGARWGVKKGKDRNGKIGLNPSKDVTRSEIASLGGILGS